MELRSFFRAWSRKFYSGVVVESITPAYYAAGERPDEFIVRGHNFDLIPNSSVATLSLANETPEMYRYSETDSNVADILEKSETEIVFKVRSVVSHSTPRYLGVIVSDDRGTIYWVNNSNPLP